LLLLAMFESLLCSSSVLILHIDFGLIPVKLDVRLWRDLVLSSSALTPVFCIAAMTEDTTRGPDDCSSMTQRRRSV
jgi:hypothetical protein